MPRVALMGQAHGCRCQGCQVASRQARSTLERLLGPFLGDLTVRSSAGSVG
jgi:hypothetical protein